MNLSSRKELINIKQNITKQQLETLSDYQFEVLFDYWWDKNCKPKNKLTPYELIEYGTGTLYKLPLLSIGDMLEFIGEKITYTIENKNSLCDDLFRIVRCLL